MLNRIVIMGRLCAAPELKKTQSGISVCSVCVAVDRPRRQDAEAQTDFLDIVAWRQTAEFLARYFGKGQQIAVDGKLQSRTWEDNEGHRRKAVEIVAEQLHFCGSKQQDSAGRAGDGPAGRAAPAEEAGYAPRDQLYGLPPSGYGNGFAEMGGPEDDLPF